MTAPSRAGIGSVGFTRRPGPASPPEGLSDRRPGWAGGRSPARPRELQQPGESYTPPAELISGLAAGGVSPDRVSYSPFRGFDPAPIAAALSRYPYGCTEQLVSTAYPLLYAPEVSGDAEAARRLRGARRRGRPSCSTARALDGAFGLWRVGDGEADPWLGAYATDFLLEAKAKGAPVPRGRHDPRAERHAPGRPARRLRVGRLPA